MLNLGEVQVFAATSLPRGKWRVQFRDNQPRYVTRFRIFPRLYPDGKINFKDHNRIKGAKIYFDDETTSLQSLPVPFPETLHYDASVHRVVKSITIEALHDHQLTICGFHLFVPAAQPRAPTAVPPEVISTANMSGSGNLCC